MTKLAGCVIALACLLTVSSAQSADTFAVYFVSQTSTTITLGWTPQPGYGYLFSVNDKVMSRTNDPSRSTVKFSKVTNGVYEVAVIVKGATGTYPPSAPPPPPPTASVTQTIANGSTVANITGWRAVFDANGDGAEDDPGVIEFYIDGTLVLSEQNAPFGDTFATGSPSSSDGQHTFLVRALTDGGALLASNSVTATVQAAAPPPPSSSYPDASTTGVPAGTSLTASGPINVTAAGTVIDARSVTDGITVNAANVIIKNTRVSSVGLYGIDVESGSATVQDVEINCGGAGRKGIFVNHGARVDVVRTNINHCEDGLYASGNFNFRDNFIHDQAASATAHNDGIQTDGQLDGVTVEHNTIYAIDTSAIAFCNNTACPSMSNVTIRNNLLAGGAYTLYCPKVATTNFQVVDNKFSTIFYPKVGAFGSNTDCAGEIFSGNVIYETGAPVLPG